MRFTVEDMMDFAMLVSKYDFDGNDRQLIAIALGEYCGKRNITLTPEEIESILNSN